jgi:serine protease inhibitor
MRQWRCFRPMSAAIVVLMSAAAASSAYTGGHGVAANTGTVNDPRVVASDNAFGLAVFKTLSRSNHQNIVISPVSISLALQIAYNGAVGTTRQSMAKALDLGSLATQQLNRTNADLLASLRNADPQVQLIIANSLWGHLGRWPMSASFTQTVETFYGAKVGDLSKAPSNVDAWVARETRGLISQILPNEPANYYERVSAIIANAIYFKGRWSRPFDARSTVLAPFTSGDATTTLTEMMQQTGDYEYLRERQFQMLRIPYGRGQLSMLIVLPNSGASLGSFIAGITADDLASWSARLQQSFGKVALPRFTATFRASLPGALTALGMGDAFCSSRAADFSGIGPGYCLSDVEHESVVKVDETGTVAAAATASEFHSTLARAPRFTMTMDRPFFYAIRDDMTGQLLFMGVLQRRPNA